MSQPIPPPPRTIRITVRAVVTTVVELAGAGLAGWSLYMLDPHALGVMVGLVLVAVGYATSS